MCGDAGPLGDIRRRAAGEGASGLAVAHWLMTPLFNVVFLV
jgi:hypothetical protein